MIQIGFLLLFSIVFAENYAVIYGTIESFTYTELPSSPCRVYSVFAFLSPLWIVFVYSWVSGGQCGVYVGYY